MRKPIFKPAGLFRVRWENFEECMRDIREKEQAERWALAFPKKKKKKDSGK